MRSTCRPFLQLQEDRTMEATNKILSLRLGKHLDCSAFARRRHVQDVRVYVRHKDSNRLRGVTCKGVHTYITSH